LHVSFSILNISISKHFVDFILCLYNSGAYWRDHIFDV
jgi:hypothetical protein